MPSHEEHARASLLKYERRFDELHRWMDEPSQLLGKEHRIYRHDAYTTPQEAKELFGEFADHACLDHIILDFRATRRRLTATPYSHYLADSIARLLPETAKLLQERPDEKYARVRLRRHWMRKRPPSPEIEEAPRKSVKDSWGTRFTDLLRLIILIKLVKYLIPGG